MKLVKTKTEREVATLREIEKQIERRERVHRFLIGGLAALLAASVAIHLVPSKKRCIFGRK